MSETKYRYEIHPRIPIRKLFNKVIAKDTTMELTIEEVRECLKFGPVYRRFDAANVIRVTVDNIEDLHREFFKKPAVPVAPKPVEAAPAVEEKKVEEAVAPVVEETPVVEEKVEESAPVEETAVVEDHVDEKTEEAPVVTEEPVAEPVVEEQAEVTESPVVEDPATEAVEVVAEEAPVEETVPEAPVEEPVEEEKTPESSEDEIPAEQSEEVKEKVEEPKPYQTGKKKKHH